MRERKVHSGVASSMVHKDKEDRRREAIGFEIPVIRGAFDLRKGSTDDSRYHQKKTSHWPICPVKHGSRRSFKCRKVGERKQLGLGLGESA